MEQTKVKEITTDRSVQELLHKLLSTEAVLQEQERYTEGKSADLKKSTAIAPST